MLESWIQFGCDIGLYSFVFPKPGNNGVFTVVYLATNGIIPEIILT